MKISIDFKRKFFVLIWINEKIKIPSVKREQCERVWEAKEKVHTHALSHTHWVCERNKNKKKLKKQTQGTTSMLKGNVIMKMPNNSIRWNIQFHICF